MRAAIYGRVCTTNNGQDPPFKPANSASFASAAAGPSSSTLTSESRARRKSGRPWTGSWPTRTSGGLTWWWSGNSIASRGRVSHLLRALETFQALGIQFVSLSEQLDTSTPTGKMVFTVLGAVAELERSLIVERVKAGLRNARAKGKRLGRPQSIRGPLQNCRFARSGAFVVKNRRHIGHWRRHRSAGRSGVRQKPTL